MKIETKKTKEKALILSLAILSLIFLSTLTIATPTGPSSINITANETKATSAARMINISGGIISKINITASMQNPHWKAFVGWIDGKFTLDDSSGSTIYDWSLGSVGGEVYSTRASSAVDWANVDCANSTHIATEDTDLEHSGEDNITATFSGTYTESFVVAGTTIDASDNCALTRTYINNETQLSSFEEVILYDSTNSDIIFATILEDGIAGFDGSAYDFQMIVPENGNATWSGSTAYYLYVELS